MALNEQRTSREEDKKKPATNNEPDENGRKVFHIIMES